MFKTNKKDKENLNTSQNKVILKKKNNRWETNAVFKTMINSSIHYVTVKQRTRLNGNR